MDKHFMDKLDEARDQSGMIFNVTSGYRCPAYNLTIGGKVGSAHTHGVAADIAVPSSRARYYMLDTFIRLGFTRIGVGKDFIHVDEDPNKTSPVIWTY
jgi:uncharacterized protein YcbK (DUF882 family)